MGKWDQLADSAAIERTMEALKQNGITAYFAQTGEDARKKALELIPKGAQVMTMTSVTCDAIGLSKEINESGNYLSVRNKLNSMDRSTQGAEMQKLGAAPDWAVGSVHAVTEQGSLLIASATGSQLPAYAYGASHVLWVVGAQKIVKNMDEAYKRLYEYTFPLENERAKKVYGMGSNVSKVLAINKEFAPNRLTLIFVNEVLGF